jgi:hypothetical protein
MKKEDFTKPFERIREILRKEPFSRDDDLFLTWKFWRSIDPGIDDLTMKEFKTLFLSGYFGLPASITRLRALCQSQDPELRGTTVVKRFDRAKIWKAYIRGYEKRGFSGLPPGGSLSDPDLQVIKDHIEGDHALEVLHKSTREEKTAVINNKSIDMRIGKKDRVKTQGESYYSVGEFLSERRRGLTVPFEDVQRIKLAARRINEQNGLAEKIRNGTGHRKGYRIEVFRFSVLDKAVNKILKENETRGDNQDQ